MPSHRLPINSRSASPEWKFESTRVMGYLSLVNYEVFITANTYTIDYRASKRAFLLHTLSDNNVSYLSHGLMTNILMKKYIRKYTRFYKSWNISRNSTIIRVRPRKAIRNDTYRENVYTYSYTYIRMETVIINQISIKEIPTVPKLYSRNLAIRYARVNGAQNNRSLYV